MHYTTYMVRQHCLIRDLVYKTKQFMGQGADEGSQKVSAAAWLTKRAKGIQAAGDTEPSPESSPKGQAPQSSQQ